MFTILSLAVVGGALALLLAALGPAHRRSSRQQPAPRGSEQVGDRDRQRVRDDLTATVTRRAADEATTVDAAEPAQPVVSVSTYGVSTS